MSDSDFTRKLLNLKDKNITFQEDYLEEIKLNRATNFIFKGTLSYQSTHREYCKALFDSNFKKNKFKTSQIVIPRFSLDDTFLELKNQRYYCGHCQFIFIIVRKNCHISYTTKHAIILDDQNKNSECRVPLLQSRFTPLMRNYSEELKKWANRFHVVVLGVP